MSKVFTFEADKLHTRCKGCAEIRKDEDGEYCSNFLFPSSQWKKKNKCGYFKPLTTKVKNVKNA